MKLLLPSILLMTVFITGCASAREPVKAKEAIKQARQESMTLVERFCVLKDTGGGEQKVKDLQEGIAWAIECENIVREATEEEKIKLQQFKATTDAWMEKVKEGDKDRLIKWTWENVSPVVNDGKKDQEPEKNKTK